MRIAGEWLPGDDGFTRPVVLAHVRGVHGRLHAEWFLVDSGADRTVFSATLLGILALPQESPPPGIVLMGVGGPTAFTRVTTVIEFSRDDGAPVHVRGQYAAFTDPLATDLSVLGRDVLDNFHIILSRRNGDVLLLAPPHGYTVSRA